MPRKDIIATVMGLYLSTETQENWSIKASQEVLERKYGNEMTQSDQDAFKVAFVIYIISTLLSPGSKYDYVSVDYWDALVDPSSIGDFDWSDYVIKKLFQAVVKLKD